MPTPRRRATMLYPYCSTGAVGTGRLCSKHGGVKPCSVPSCTTGARGKSGLCYKHSRPSRGDQDDLIIPLRPICVDTLLEMDEYFQDSTEYCDSLMHLPILETEIWPVLDNYSDSSNIISPTNPSCISES